MPDSDIDVMIVLNGEIEKSLQRQACLIQNFTFTLFKHKNFVRLGTMERKAKK